MHRYPIGPEPPRRRGLITPGRVVVVLAIGASVVLVLYGLVRRDQAQIPILSAGLLVLGLTLLATGLWSAGAAYRDARAGRGGPAFGGSLFGGLCVLAGSGALALAVILALVWESA